DFTGMGLEHFTLHAWELAHGCSSTKRRAPGRNGRPVRFGAHRPISSFRAKGWPLEGLKALWPSLHLTLQTRGVLLVQRGRLAEGPLSHQRTWAIASGTIVGRKSTIRSASSMSILGPRTSALQLQHLGLRRIVGRAHTCQGRSGTAFS